VDKNKDLVGFLDKISKKIDITFFTFYTIYSIILKTNYKPLIFIHLHSLYYYYRYSNNIYINKYLRREKNFI
jgi:hypothetical protein